LALRALRLSLAGCEFADAVLLTDTPTRDLPAVDGVRVVAIPTLRDSAAYSRFMLKSLVDHVATDRVQVVQWDGYVVNPAAWSDAFLEYDYIGAKWWFRPEGSNVGNGGFSLRSRRLLEALRDPAITTDGAEDAKIGIQSRPLLEQRYGIRFAPSSVADAYAFEGELPSGREFGFHRAFNLPYFLAEGELAKVFAAVDDATFCNPGAVTLVEKLAALRRPVECLAYANRLRACAGYGAIPPAFRAALVRLLMTLSPRESPCPCGSGNPYRRCCGDLRKWEPGGPAAPQR
jgi:hypothetical protein